ncbi:MAG: hypothetical protein HY855_08595 [Burkholderiales bacterium]|nr:hypothetical protein [Burkholderiales bacterium]
MMASKTILAILGLAALAAAGWHYRDTEPLRSFLHPARGAAGAAAGGTGGAAGPGRGAAASQFKLLRKCVKDGQPTYTDDACPPGSQEQPMTGGAVTVLPALREAPTLKLPSAAGPAASGPSLREALLPPGNDNLRDKRMERVIQQ